VTLSRDGEPLTERPVEAVRGATSGANLA